jgi:hypothetical protein
MAMSLYHRDEASWDGAGVYEQLRDLMLYLGGRVDYDRYVDPALYRRLLELGLVVQHPDGAFEFSPLGADVYSQLTRGDDAPELLWPE